MADEILVNDPVPIGEKVIDLICLAWASRRPIILRGPHGMGKSEIVEEAAKAMDINYRCMDLSIMEPPDLLGMPKIDDNILKYFPPATLPQGEKIKVSNGKKKTKTVLNSGVLCFEELNRCDDAMQAPCLQLLTARKLNEYELPSGWSIIACINPSGDQYNVNDIDPALLSRFMVVDICAGKKEWLKWASKHKVHEAIVNVVSEHPDPFNTKSGVPPRTWKYVSDVLNAFAEYEGLNEQVLLDAVKGYLNTEWAAAVKEALVDMGEYEKEDLEDDVDDDEEMVDPQSLKGKDKLPDIKELVAKYTTGYRKQVKNMSRAKVSANMELLANCFNNMIYKPDADKFCEHILKQRHVNNLNKLLSDIPKDAKQTFKNCLNNDLRGAFKMDEDQTGQIVKSIQLDDPDVLRKNMINLLYATKTRRGRRKKVAKTW